MITGLLIGIAITGYATYYDYSLSGHGEWSKKSATCALRLPQRYGKYKVTNIANGKFVICYHNDYGPKAYTNKIIDLSSYAFKKLAPLKLGVIQVKVEKVK